MFAQSASYFISGSRALETLELTETDANQGYRIPNVDQSVKQVTQNETETRTTTAGQVGCFPSKIHISKLVAGNKSKFFLFQYNKRHTTCFPFSLNSISFFPFYKHG